MSECLSGLQSASYGQALAVSGMDSGPAAASGICKNIDTKRRELTARQGGVDIQRGEDTQIWNDWVGLSRTWEKEAGDIFTEAKADGS